jgi:hypothetical protein
MVHPGTNGAGAERKISAFLTGWIVKTGAN